MFTLDAVSQVESGQSSQAQENKGTLEFWDGRGFPVTDHTHKPSVPSSKFHDAKICNILSPTTKKNNNKIPAKNKSVPLKREDTDDLLG